MKKTLYLILIVAFFVLSPLAARQALADILFVGGEDNEFKCVGICSVSTSSSNYVTGYARLALATYGQASQNPPTDSWQSPSFTAASDFWVHATFAPVTGANGTNSQAFALLSPGDNIARIVVAGTGSSGQWKIRKGNAAGTFTDLASVTSPVFGGSGGRVDLHVNYAVSGSATLYVNGDQVASYTGDVTTDGVTSLSALRLSNPTTSGYGVYWSEVIIATTDTRPLRLVTMAASANGTTTNWTNGGVTNINETTLNDTTINSSGTAGQIQLYTVGDLPAIALDVVDVWENIRAQVDTTGPQHIRAMLRTGGSNYTSGNLSPPQLTWGLVSHHWPTNPNTSAAWTIGEVNALETGFDSQN
jgi:hypothetical protein